VRGRPARVASTDTPMVVATSTDAPATPASAGMDDVTGMRLVSIQYPLARDSATDGDRALDEMQVLRDDERDFGEAMMKPMVRPVRPRRLGATTLVTMDAPLPAARAIASTQPTLADAVTSSLSEAAEEDQGDIEDVLAAPRRRRTPTHRLPLAQQVAKADQEAEAHERQELTRQQQRCVPRHPSSIASEFGRASFFTHLDTYIYMHACTNACVFTIFTTIFFFFLSLSLSHTHTHTHTLPPTLSSF
jgi:hypothetical protein